MSQATCTFSASVGTSILAVTGPGTIVSVSQVQPSYQEGEYVLYDCADVRFAGPLTQIWPFGLGGPSQPSPAGLSFVNGLVMTIPCDPFILPLNAAPQYLVNY